MLEVGGQAAEGSGIEARSGDQSARSAENFSPSFFSYQDGLLCKGVGRSPGVERPYIEAA